MGARVYAPSLGHFLQVDPVEGGTLNNYVYAMDPVNEYDLNGKWIFLAPIIWTVVRAIVVRVAPIVVAAIVKHASQVANTITNAAKAVGNALKGSTSVAKTASNASKGVSRTSSSSKPNSPPAPKTVQTPNMVGSRQLPDGRIRTYGKFKPASQQGEMAGARKVTEYNPITRQTRHWNETLDHAGNVRRVRPFDTHIGGTYRHYNFDANGLYLGMW